MKRFVSLLLIFVLFTVCTIGVVPVSAADDDVSVPLGDANTDGDVDIIDATIIRRYCVNFGNNLSFLGADVDGDGYVSVIDATFIQRYLVGMTTPYEIGTKSVPVRYSDKNNELRRSNERVDKLLDPLSGDGTVYINDILLTDEDAQAFYESVVARDSVDWFFEKYHLTEAYGWSVDSQDGIYFDENMSDSEYTAAMQDTTWLYRLCLSYCIEDGTQEYEYDLDFTCDDMDLHLTSSVHTRVWGNASADMSSLKIPVYFGSSKPFFGNDESVCAFDLDSYKSFMDYCGYDISDFDSIDSYCYPGDCDSQFVCDVRTGNDDDYEDALEHGDEVGPLKYIEMTFSYWDDNDSAKSLSMGYASGVYDDYRNKDVTSMYIDSHRYSRTFDISEDFADGYVSACEYVDFNVRFTDKA